MRLLSRYSVLEASNEASLRQAQNVSEECKRLMDENDKLKKVMLKGMLGSNEFCYMHHHGCLVTLPDAAMLLK